jgi:hypothetical protein
MTLSKGRIIHGPKVQKSSGRNHCHDPKNLFIFQGLTFFLAYSIFSAVLGMLQFGYNTGVINAPEQVSDIVFVYETYFFVYGGERGFLKQGM